MAIVSRILLALVFIVTIVVVQPNCAYACSCVPPGTPAEELHRSDAVFLGKALTVNVPNKPIESSADVTTVTFEASKVWKGQLPQTLTLTTPGASASCGVTFTQGEEYVVYARLNEGALTTTLCSRTNAAANAAEDIAALNGNQAPQAPSHLPSTGAAENTVVSGALPLLVALGIVVIVFGASLVVVGRRNRLN